MVLIQKIGLALFLLALLLFTATLGLDRYEFSEEKLAPAIDNKYHLQELVRIADERGTLGEAYGSSFEYVPVLKNLLEAAGESLAAQAEEGVPEGVSRSDFTLPDWKMKNYILPATKQASVGPVSRNPLLFLLLTVGLGIFGGLLYILPKFNLLPGIKHDHIYHRSMTRGLNLGIRGFFLGLTIVGVLLYGVFYMGKDYFWPGVTLGLGAYYHGFGILLPALRQTPTGEVRFA